MNTEVDAGKRVPAADDASDNRRRFYPFKKPRYLLVQAAAAAVLQPCRSRPSVASGKPLLPSGRV